MNTCKKNCYIVFHQGYTDIINCLSLINYNIDKYECIYVIIRKDMKNMMDYLYKNNYNNINFIYIEKQNDGILENMDKFYDYFEQIINNCDNEIQFFGLYDIYRKDKYTNKFAMTNGFFVQKFYEAYDINYNIRIEKFIFNRNYKQENDLYLRVNPNNDKYILIHENVSNNILINRNFITNNYKIINLDMLSDIFFDAIKLIENAEEIHCIDSSWLTFIYLLNSKYKLLNAKINIYGHCIRNYHEMYNPKFDNMILL
ncbi:hypothetical protein BMW23_0557 [Bodo saltans virus]|uniref:Uncharacterized protein n=1 Tax=Bodo saltans virus TaxID=2024608 RepID=A0A2H4UUQ2_9VIRU|nr:hypothetical protein QJ851_gp0541 [Bodo saltans virus]ATZ80604.1 hypothetical protein BMW23_0557 [Bodo saltans virus]